MSGAQPDPPFLEIAGRHIAYRSRSGSAPTLFFLPGYASDMEGTKARALDAFAERSGLAMLRFDYSGTGSSGGNFEDGTLAAWLDEALALIDRLTEGPLIPIGSSMGGWLALHVALCRPQRVRALVGIAAAPDFTDWGFTAEEKAALKRDGRLERLNPYGTEPELITHGFWQSGGALRVLNAPIMLDCPVRLIHGEADTDVPISVAMSLMQQLRSADVQLNILKGGGHRLSEPHEIEAILQTVEALLEPTP